MFSRLHKIGTIYSRIQGLIEKGMIKKGEEPIWYDLYSHFPPKYEPFYNRPAPEMEVRQILYPEDVVRSKLHKKYHKQLGLINLDSKEETESQKMMKAYNTYISEGMSENEAINKVGKTTSGPFTQDFFQEDKKKDV